MTLNQYEQIKKAQLDFLDSEILKTEKLEDTSEKNIFYLKSLHAAKRSVEEATYRDFLVEYDVCGWGQDFC